MDKLFDNWNVSKKFLHLFLIAILLSNSAYASKFWGVVGNQSVGTWQTWYENQAGYLCKIANCPQVSATSPHGWGCMDWVPGGPPAILQLVRESTAVYTGDSCSPTSTCTDRYDSAITAAGTNGARLVMAHARRNSASHGFPGPHPFVYGRYNSFIALAHNGTINSMRSLEDSLGAGFVALDSFVVRKWTSWSDGRPTDTGDTIVDSEYYTAMFMKRLLVGDNYYWQPAVDTITTPTNFAIMTTLRQMDLLTDPPGAPPRYTSLNAEIGCMDTLWSIHLHDPNDLEHRVSYWSKADTTQYRQTVSYIHPDGANWTTQPNSTVVRLVPGSTATTYSYAPTVAGRAGYYGPQELRVNGREFSSGDQTQSAIATDPVKSTFAVVWRTSSGNNIKIRWYNQMGLATGPEDTVNTGSAADRRNPAIAYTPNGDTAMVVWSEKAVASNVFGLIKARRLWWNPAQQRWDGSAEFILNSTVIYDSDLPCVAMRSDGGYAVAWQRYNTATSTYEIRWSGKTTLATLTDVAMGNYGGNNYDPDVCNIEGSNNRYAFVWEGNPSGIYSCIVFNDLLQIGPPTALLTAPVNPTTYNPSVAMVTPGGQFILAYYSVGIGAMKVSSGTSGTPSVVATYTGGELAGSVTQIDVAGRANGQFELCYDKNSATYGLDVYVVADSGTFLSAPHRIPTGAVGNATYATQQRPSIAISKSYRCNVSGFPAKYYTDSLSTSDRFDQRRMVVWESSGQDSSGYAIVGKFQGINSVNPFYEWYFPDALRSDLLGAVFSSEDKIDAQNYIQTPNGEGHLDGVDDLQHEKSVTPLEFRLFEPYPNPFNPTTTISFSLPEGSDASLNVFDVTGRLIAEIVRSYQSAGTHTYYFDGSKYAAGMYFVRLTAGDHQQIRKMLLLK